MQYDEDAAIDALCGILDQAPSDAIRIRLTIEAQVMLLDQMPDTSRHSLAKAIIRRMESWLELDRQIWGTERAEHERDERLASDIRRELHRIDDAMPIEGDDPKESLERTCDVLQNIRDMITCEQ